MSSAKNDTQINWKLNNVRLAATHASVQKGAIGRTTWKDSISKCMEDNLIWHLKAIQIKKQIVGKKRFFFIQNES